MFMDRFLMAQHGPVVYMKERDVSNAKNWQNTEKLTNDFLSKVRRKIWIIKVSFFFFLNVLMT